MFSIISRVLISSCTNRVAAAAGVVLLAAAFAPGLAIAQAPCHVAPDPNTGIVTLPPAGCGYVSPNDLHMIIDGLPPGTTVEIGPEHFEFFNIVTTPGCGSLGGNCERANSQLRLNMKGTGMLAGYNRTLVVPHIFETHTGPRDPNDPVQSFDTVMFQLQGQLPPGDPDFDLLRITAGSGFGLPSPGHTTLTRLPGGDWNVDSFFDITYRIDFVGAPGGPFAGRSGSTTGTIRMQAGVSAASNPCVQPDAGGTVALPPAGCGYVSPADLHMIINGLPPGTTIQVGAQHDRFFNVIRSPGGSLGGEVEQFGSNLGLMLSGTGGLAGYSRSLMMPMQAETHVGPRAPGTSPQSFDTEMFRLQGQLPPGDPDFDLLRITAGSFFGLPSPGHTTLTQLPGGNWNVDSFFDITYRIDFVGAPGGPLAGMSGSTTATIRMQTGSPPAGCPPIPAGTDAFPSTAKLVVQITMDDGTPSGPAFVLRGSSAGWPDTIVQRGPQVGSSIPVEIVSLNLRSVHPQTGGEAFHFESASMQSFGRLDNVVQNPADCTLMSADSFFDVFIDVQVPALGETWSNRDPLHIVSKIGSLPPKNARYENPFVRPVVLFDQATGLPRAQVLYELHHVDPPFPPGGNDCFPTDIQVDLTTQLGQSMARGSGPTTVRRSDPIAGGFCSGSQQPCASAQDCPVGDTCILPPPRIETEIVEMQLSGFDPLLGPWMLRQSPAMPSRGVAVSQQPDQTYPADSFFDVFVEIDLQAQGITLHNEQPVQLMAMDGNNPAISDVPPAPGTDFMSRPGSPPVPLFDESGRQVGQIDRVGHRLQPPVSWQPPPPPDEYCFESWIVLRIKIFASGCEETIMLPGGFRILRSSATDPGDGRDLLKTLIYKALLNGTSACLGGPLTLSLSQTNASGGQVQSLAPDENEPYDSFFDVFADIQVAGMPGRFEVGPARMTTTINTLPPEDGETYWGPGTVIPLRDAAGNIIGEIEEVKHEVHRRILPCPCECRPTMEAKGPSTFTMLSAGTGAGAGYDWVRLRRDPSGFVPNMVICNGPAELMDPTIPPTGQVFFYLTRDRFADFSGSFDDCDPGPINWDAFLAGICGP